MNRCDVCNAEFREPEHYTIYRQTFHDPEEFALICPECGSEEFTEFTEEDEE